MDTDPFESLARLTPALHGTDGDFSARGGHRVLRAEAIRQARWLQRAWARTLTTHTAGTSGLSGPTARARRTDDADGQRQMGEDAPSWFD
jgi:hypothetical protein